MLCSPTCWLWSRTVLSKMLMLTSSRGRTIATQTQVAFKYVLSGPSYFYVFDVIVTTNINTLASHFRPPPGLTLYNPCYAIIPSTPTTLDSTSTPTLYLTILFLHPLQLDYSVLWGHRKLQEIINVLWLLLVRTYLRKQWVELDCGHVDCVPSTIGGTVLCKTLW